KRYHVTAHTTAITRYCCCVDQDAHRKKLTGSRCGIWCRRVRVAMTLEQCWHRVPGGTAVSTIELARELERRDDVDLIGVAARHRDLPAREWAPPIPTRQLWAPRPLLYELWHARVPFAPRVERATGAGDVVHATAVAFPRCDAP